MPSDLFHPAASAPAELPSADLPSADLYDVITRRRDVRAQFTGEPVADEALQRILAAAHAAPSVGMTQPWDFILVRDQGLRQQFQQHVAGERDVFNASLSDAEAQTFARIKIEGILESSLGIVITYDADRGSPAVLGRHAIADAGLYSTCLAIQNLWLAATAEGLGVGWVSFYREPFLQELLEIPAGVRPVAWLCVGPVSHLEEVPDLERLGWRSRRPLADAIHQDRYTG
ncbi:cob(II)yrinic acid a,c-diamide reductase [Frankineae bacterium MT45]|nr:cob(II)yrinic acid a,c-diamide reductase [Frankineae bacterium MT45]